MGWKVIDTNRPPSIWKVVYRRGLMKDPWGWRELKTTVLEAGDLSGDVVRSLLENGLLDAGGVYGIPKARDPWAVNNIEILHEHGVTEITVYNMDIMLLSSGDEIFPRVSRVCGAIEKQINDMSLVRKFRDKPTATTVPIPGSESGPPQRETKQVYQIKVELLETDPPVWRRFLVPSNVTLHRLHLILQDVMGWTNSHLYRFTFGAKEYAIPDPDDDFNELHFKDSRRAKLGRLVTGKGTAFLYQYDFGDGWNHMIVVEDIREYDLQEHFPKCIGGERACPPEDCGGSHGYMRLLGIISNPDHEEYREMMRWLGRRFVPSSFRLDTVNRRLRSMRL
jgi:hypothetical protein